MSKTRAPDLDGVPLAERADVLLDRALEQGALPASTQKLLELTRRDDADIGPVVEALARDAGLAAAVLRVANSAAYGQARSIGDLQRAVTVIGMQELHDVVAGSAMLAAFSTPHPLSERIQQTAVLSATIAQKLAAKLKAGSPSAAYLSGLMCELGALACLALDPEFNAIYGDSDGNAQRRFEGEALRYGGTTPDIGGRILKASALPGDVAEAVATTGLEPGADTVTLGRVVAFARLAALALLRAVEHGDADVLREELVSSSATVGLKGAEPDMLMDVCLAAANGAALKLGGVLGLAQTAADNDAAVAPRASRAAEKKGWWDRLRGR
jgi:HD-like signal output (HDOD) protein